MQRTIEIRGWTVDPGLNEMRRGGEVVRLSPKAVDVLRVLVDRRGETVTRDELMAAAWTGRVVTEGAINRVIAELRRAFGDDAGATGIIATIPKRGYRLLREPRPASQTATSDDRRAGYRFAAAVVCGIVLVAAAAWMLRPESGVRDRSSAASDGRFVLETVVPMTGNQDWPALSRDGQWLAYSYRARDDDRWRIRIASRAAPERHRTLAIGDADGFSPAFSPDGSKIAFHRLDTGGRCAIVVHDLDDGSEMPPTDCGTRTTRVAWSGGGSLYFSDTDRRSEPMRIHRVDLLTGERRVLTEPPNQGRGDYRLAVDPDRPERLAWLRHLGDGRVALLIVEAPGSTPRQLGTFGELVSDLHFSGQYRLLLAVGVNRVAEVDTASGETRILFQHTERISTLAPDRESGSMLLATGAYSRLALLAGGDGDWRTLATGPGNARAPDLAPDGRLAFVSDRSGENQVWLLAGWDSEPTRLTDFEQCRSLPMVRFSPGGDRIAGVADGRLFVVDLVGGGTTHPGDVLDEVRSVNWRADGAGLLVSARGAGGPQIFELSLESGEPVPLTNRGGTLASWSPAGRYLILTRPNHRGLWRLEPASGGLEQLLGELPPGAVEELRIDGDRVLVTLADENATRMVSVDVESGAIVEVLHTPWPTVGGFAVATEGSPRTLVMTAPRREDSSIVRLAIR